MVSMLGIRQLAVVVNKMDLVEWDRAVYDRIVREYGAFLEQVGIRPSGFIPVSGRGGDNIADRSANLPWYHGPTVLGALDAFHSEPAPVNQPFRMPVQDVYKFTKQGDDRRIVAGTIDSGALSVGDTVVFYPSGKKSRVKTIEAFNRPTQTRAVAGSQVGFTLQEQIYITRGEIAALEHEPRPQVTTRLRVSLFWLGKDPMVKRKEYLLKLGTARVTFRLEEVLRVMVAKDIATVVPIAAPRKPKNLIMLMLKTIFNTAINTAIRLCI
jgi:bifunctional enzyme CysN/CysC